MNAQYDPYGLFADCSNRNGIILTARNLSVSDRGIYLKAAEITIL